MDMTKLYETANAAVERGNYDYAITLLMDLLKMQPGHREARKKLRETVVRKFQQSGKTGGANAWLSGLPWLIKILIAKLGKKHDKVLIECESFLLKDPRNKLVLTMLGESALQLGLNKVALDTYEWAHECHRKDARLVFRLSQIYTLEHDIPKATEHLESYRRMMPEDRVAEQMLRDLAAQQTIEKGYGKAATGGTSRELVKDKEETERLQDEERIMRTDDDVSRAITRAEKDLELDPKNRKALNALGQLYRRVKRFDEALKMYERSLALDPSNLEVQDAVAEINYQKMLQEVEHLEQKAAAQNAPPELAQQVEQKKTQAREFWMNELLRRVRARPTDLATRHNYGQFLFESGRWDEALAQFQHSRRDPRFRREANNLMGQCLFHKGMYDMAEKQYAAAYEGTEFVDDLAKEVLYNWAMAAEAAGHEEQYEEKIRQLYENDVSYRDVGERMNAIYKKQSTGRK